ncbi:MAG: hypothetical protein AVDCRST_MAG91-114, partial [uncultured Sphingomonadaceae bacterium]
AISRPLPAGRLADRRRSEPRLCRVSLGPGGAADPSDARGAVG